MRDLEELKKAWQQTTVNPEQLEADNRLMAERLGVKRAVTAQQKLAQYYRRSFYAGLLLPVLSPTLIYILHFPIWLAAFYAFFGIVMAAVNISFARYITRCDYLSQPIVTALANAIKIARRQRTLHAVSITLACILILTMTLQAITSVEANITEGIFAGAAVGAVIAYKKVKAMNRLVNQMQSELRSTINPGK